MLKPLNDKVIIEILEEPGLSSHIYMPKNDKTNYGVIIAVGPGKDGKAMSVKVGDKVYFQKYATSEISFEKKTYICISEYDILAKIEG